MIMNKLGGNQRKGIAAMTPIEDPPDIGELQLGPMS